jgi:hypothetical protein
MSSVDIPTASFVESESSSVVEEMAIDLDTLTAALKSLEPADLFKVMKQALAEAEKRSKGTKATTVAKKAGSMPKGVVPKQLMKPRAWVDFTLQHALHNGWESFTVYQSKKDKLTGEVVEEEIEMPGSMLFDGAYVYEGSVTEKQPTGKQLIHKDAMSLSKQRWSPKDKVGTHPELYEEFEAEYAAAEPDVSDTASEATASTATKKVVVKMTAAEKLAAAEAKKAEKEAEKAAKKAAKEEEKAAKKAEKEAEKAAAKAAKEAEKAAKKAEKEAAKKPAAKAPIPAAAVRKIVDAGAAAPVKATNAVAVAPVKAAAVAPVKATNAVAAAPVKAAAVPVKKAVVKPVVEAWSCPDGMVLPWTFKGKTYLRSSENEIWLRAADGGCGDWQGVYLPTEDRIDDSVPEPEDEE